MAKVPFLRDATGLTREIGLLDGAAMNFSFAGPLSLGTAYTLSFVLSAFPGGDIMLGYVLGFVLSMFLFATIGLLVSVYPKSGGEYTAVSRVFNPAIGFTSSWGWWLNSAMSTLGWQGTMIIFWGLAPTLYIFGALWQMPNLFGLAQATEGAVWGLIFTTVLIAIVIGIWLTGLGKSARLNTIMVVMTWVGWIIMLAALATTSTSALISRFNAAAYSISGATNAYQGIITSAQSFGYSVPQTFDYSAGTVLGVVGLTGLFIAYETASIYIGGEMKKASTPFRQVSSMGLALGANVLGAMAATYLLIQKTSWEFLAAFNYLATTQPQALPFPMTPGGWFLFTVAMAASSSLVALIIALTFILSGFTLMIVCNVYSRITFAWAFDRIAPSCLASVSTRFKQPLISMILFAVVAWISAILYAFYPTYIFLFVGGIGVANALMLFLPDCITALILPYRKTTRAHYEASATSKLKIGTVPVIVILALISISWPLIMAWGYIPTTNPVSLTALVVVYIVGIAIYYVAKYYRKAREGIDLGLIFQSIPPD
ncbi:MAG: amino acid permease [Candidatus Bathyarchaeia archaeon]